MAGLDFDSLLPLQGAAPKSCQKRDMAGRDFDPLLPLQGAAPKFCHLGDMAGRDLAARGAHHAVFDWVDGLLLTDWVAIILRKTAENPARASCRALHNSSAGGKTHATFITYRPVRGEKLLHNLLI